MTHDINNIRYRFSGIAVRLCMVLLCSIAVDTVHAQSDQRNEKPFNLAAREGRGQARERQPRRWPSQRMGERDNDTRPDMRGDRNREGLPPREGLDGPPDRRGPKPKSWQDLSKKERAEVVEFLEEHFPLMSIELKNLRDRNPEVFKRRMRRVIPEVRRVMELMKINPQRAKLHIQERKLDMQMRYKANMFRKSRDDLQRVKLRQELDDLATQGFDVQLQLRQMEISDLQTRMGELATRLEEAKELRPKMIRQRVETLLSADRNRPPRDDMAQPERPR